MRCLNELEEGSCQAVFKPWHARLDSSGPNLRSQEDDPELLLYVPFDGAVSLKAICVIGGPDGRGPAKLRVNRRMGGLHGARSAANGAASATHDRNIAQIFRDDLAAIIHNEIIEITLCPPPALAPRCMSTERIWILGWWQTCSPSRSGISLTTQPVSWTIPHSE